MSVFSIITNINKFFEILTTPHLFGANQFIKFNKNLPPPIYFDPLFIRQLRVPISGVSISNLSYHQLQYALGNGIITYLFQAFELLI